MKYRGEAKMAATGENVTAFMPRVSRSGGAGGGGLEAQREIVDTIVIRLQEFLDGERDFDDAVTVEDTIVEVDVCPDGSIMDENGNGFR